MRGDAFGTQKFPPGTGKADATYQNEKPDQIIWLLNRTKRPYQEWKTKPYPSHILMMPDKARRTSTSRQESYRENREDIGAFGEFLMNVMRRADAQKWIAVTPSASRQLIHPCQRKERRPIGTEFNCRKSGMSTGMKDLGIGTYYWTEPIFIVSTSRHK